MKEKLNVRSPGITCAQYTSLSIVTGLLIICSRFIHYHSSVSSPVIQKIGQRFILKIDKATLDIYKPFEKCALTVNELFFVNELQSGGMKNEIVIKTQT